MLHITIWPFKLICDSAKWKSVFKFETGVIKMKLTSKSTTVIDLKVKVKWNVLTVNVDIKLTCTTSNTGTFFLYIINSSRPLNAYQCIMKWGQCQITLCDRLYIPSITDLVLTITDNIYWWRETFTVFFFLNLYCHCTSLKRSAKLDWL